MRWFEIASSCAARQPGYAVYVLRMVSVEGQAHFVWNVTWRFNYGDRFLHASLRDAVIHDVAVGLTLTAEAERFLKSVVKRPDGSHVGDTKVDMIENHHVALGIGRPHP